MRQFVGGRVLAGGALISVVFLVVFFFYSTLAEAVWRNTHNFTATLFLRPTDAGFLFEIGNYYFNGGAYDLVKAQRAYQEAIKIDENYPGPHYQLARIYFLKAD